MMRKKEKKKGNKSRGQITGDEQIFFVAFSKMEETFEIFFPKMVHIYFRYILPMIVVFVLALKTWRALVRRRKEALELEGQQMVYIHQNPRSYSTSFLNGGYHYPERGRSRR